jgi:hypothetical protein
MRRVKAPKMKDHCAPKKTRSEKPDYCGKA